MNEQEWGDDDDDGATFVKGKKCGSVFLLDISLVDGFFPSKFLERGLTNR